MRASVGVVVPLRITTSVYTVQVNKHLGLAEKWGVRNEKMGRVWVQNDKYVLAQQLLGGLSPAWGMAPWLGFYSALD